MKVLSVLFLTIFTSCANRGYKLSEQTASNDNAVSSEKSIQDQYYTAQFKENFLNLKAKKVETTIGKDGYLINP